MKSFFKAVGVFTLVSGLTGVFIFANSFGGSNSLSLGFIIVGGLGTLLTSGLMFALAEILERLETIANAVSGNTQPEIKPEIKTEQSNNTFIDKSFWKCSHCGTINANTVKKCWCGEKKDE